MKAISICDHGNCWFPASEKNLKTGGLFCGRHPVRTKYREDRSGLSLSLIEEYYPARVHELGYWVVFRDGVFGNKQMCINAHLEKYQNVLVVEGIRRDKEKAKDFMDKLEPRYNPRVSPPQWYIDFQSARTDYLVSLKMKSPEEYSWFDERDLISILGCEYSYEEVKGLDKIYKNYYVSNINTEVFEAPRPKHSAVKLMIPSVKNLNLPLFEKPDICLDNLFGA